MFSLEYRTAHAHVPPHGGEKLRNGAKFCRRDCERTTSRSLRPHTPKSGMSSQQLPSYFYSAASLQSSSADCRSSSGIGSSLAAFSSSSFSSSRSPLSDTESSIGASSTSGCGGEEDADWCLPRAETRRTRGGRSRNRRARRRGEGQRQPLYRVPVNRGGPSASKRNRKTPEKRRE